MRTYVHIGLDKCGSSSLQKFFSQNPYITNINNTKFEYRCFTKNGTLNGNQVKKLQNKERCGYISSVGLSSMKSFDKNKFESFRKKNNSKNVDLIYSCEGWYRALVNKELFINLCSSLEGSIKRELIFIAFLRSPVEWINSAWWQWGAWQCKNYIEFEEWLEKSTLNTCWYRYFKNFKSLANNHKLILKPVNNDVVKDMCKILNLNQKKYITKKTNSSFPIEIYKLYMEYEELRPNNHSNKIDYILSDLINQSHLKDINSPWILNEQHINFILNHTKKSTKKLVSLLDIIDQKNILENPAWWDVNYYKNKITYDPFLKDFKLNKNLLSLFSTLLIKNYI